MPKPKPARKSVTRSRTRFAFVVSVKTRLPYSSQQYIRELVRAALRNHMAIAEASVSPVREA